MARIIGLWAIDPTDFCAKNRWWPKSSYWNRIFSITCWGRLLAAYSGQASAQGPLWMVGLPIRHPSFKRTRAPEQIALAEVNPQLLQMLEFSLTLDSFSNDFSPQYLTQQSEAIHQRLFGRVDVDVTNHRKVDLDDRGPEPDEIPQVDSAPGEVVHG